MGRNDFNNGQTVAEIQGSTITAADIITRCIGTAVFAVTITPRNSGLGDADQAVYNSWLENEETYSGPWLTSLAWLLALWRHSP